MPFHPPPLFACPTVFPIAGRYVDIAKTSSGRFLLQKILRFGTKEIRKQVMKELGAEVFRLLRHRVRFCVAPGTVCFIPTFTLRRQHASDVLEYFFNQLASLDERQFLLAQLFGSELVDALAPVRVSIIMLCES